jgi:hypothetical protein
MHIGNAFQNVSGILSGNPNSIVRQEIERIDHLFKEPDGPPDMMERQPR